LAVPANTPGALAGLKTNDIITAVDGQAITATTSLSELLATYEPGQNARFSLLRAGAPLEITIPLGDDLIY
jgi:S1-C subfamily serine protease